MCYVHHLGEREGGRKGRGEGGGGRERGREGGREEEGKEGGREEIFHKVPHCLCVSILVCTCHYSTGFLS